MTREDYAAYQAAVAAFFEREQIENLSTDSEDSYFSWRPCGCCNRPLGGSRERATGHNLEHDVICEYEICLDCVYYTEYGQLDDMTMLELA